MIDRLWAGWRIPYVESDGDGSTIPRDPTQSTTGLRPCFVVGGTALGSSICPVDGSVIVSRGFVFAGLGDGTVMPPPWNQTVEPVPA